MKKHGTRAAPEVNPQDRPRATHAGTIFGGVDCYVLEGGQTILSKSGMVRGLRKSDRAEDGAIDRYLARLPEKYSQLATAPFQEFIRPDGGVAHGRPAGDFVSMCCAYAEMLEDGSIHKARLALARNAIAILRHLAGRGIDEIIYEACGYQKAAPMVVQAAPAMDIAVIRAAFAEELSEVKTRLATLEASTSTVVANTGPIIGERAAEIHIKAPLREAARIQAGAINNDGAFQRLRNTLDDTLRAALGFPRSGGMSWAMLPTTKLGDAQDKIVTILSNARSLSGARAKKPVQLTLVANANGKKGAA